MSRKTTNRRHSPEYWDNPELKGVLPALGSYGCPSNPRGVQVDPSIKRAWLRQLAIDMVEK